jgi:hypothetical protein
MVWSWSQHQSDGARAVYEFEREQRVRTDTPHDVSYRTRVRPVDVQIMLLADANNGRATTLRFVSSWPLTSNITIYPILLPLAAE